MVAPRSANSQFLGAAIAGLLVVLFCLLLLGHDPLVFWNDDYELSILPVFADVARSWSQGHWPLLTPYSWVCGNLAGEFQYGTFSIFINAVVVLIWKFPLTFPQQAATLSIAHLFVLAAGAFLLAGNRKLSLPLSIFVALIAALNGWIICWGATDWFGALGAFTWFPWAWWGLERALEPQRSRWRFLWPAPFVYFLVTGGFPYTVLMLALLISWLSIKTLVETKSLLSILPMLLGVVLGFGISAPAWLALFDYVHGSARETQPSAAHWQWIIPLRALPGLILPSWTVNWADFSTRYRPHTATELACGIVPAPVLLAGFIWRGRLLVRQLKWEFILLVFVLLLSMLPMFGFFRWSFRWLPFFHLLLAICAAEVLKIRPGSPTFAATFLSLVVVTIAMLIFGTAGLYGPALAWIYLELGAVWVLAELVMRSSKFREWSLVCFVFASLLATYFCIPPNCGVPKYNFSQELTKPEPLDPKRLYLAVYSPAEYVYRHEYRNGPVGQIARPGSTPMWARLRFINGYSPILAAGVARELKFFIHGEIDRAVGEHLVGDESGPDGLLEKLGVDGIVIAREISVEPAPSGWQLEFSNNEGRVFHRRDDPIPPVRSVDRIDSRPNESFAPASISRIDDSRNYSALDVDVPDRGATALITFSRPYFRGYRAELGKQTLPVDSYRGLFPVVELPSGSHGRLVLAYRPWWLVFGGCVAILSAGIFVAALALAGVSRVGRKAIQYTSRL